MADEKKKRRGRRAYLEDFHQNVAGEYIYTGQTHAWKAPRGKTLRKLWLCAIAAIGAAVAAGCVPNTGMERRVWALIPYVLMLISSGVQGWLLYKLTDGGDPVRDYVWKASVPRLPAAGIVTGILAFTSIVTEIANIFAGWSDFCCSQPDGQRAGMGVKVVIFHKDMEKIRGMN